MRAHRWTETTEACVPVCDRDRLKGLFITIKTNSDGEEEERNGTERAAGGTPVSLPFSVSISLEECKQSI